MTARRHNQPHHLGMSHSSWPRRARLDGLYAAAIANVGSFVFYLPVYAAMAGTSVFKAPSFDVALQAIVRGVLTAIVALLMYGRMVRLLGASAGAAFVALTAGMAAVIAIISV